MTIEPVYLSSTANAPIELGSAQIEISAGGQSVIGDGKVFLRFVPQDRVVVEASLPMRIARHLFLREGVISFRYGDNGKTTKAIAEWSQIDQKNGLFRTHLLPSSGDFVHCRDRRVRLKQAVFHILNFPNFFGARNISTDEARGMVRRLVLNHQKWKLEIEAAPNAADLIDQLKREGGHAITHFGCLSRTDSRSFSIQAAEKAISELHRFVSFARGKWTGIFGIAGFGTDQNLVYQGWQDRMSSPWGSAYGWFDRHHAQTLAQAYGGFARLLGNNDLGESAEKALYWYLRANRGGDGAGSAGVDGGVILAQAALERLAVAGLTSSGLPTNGSAAELLRRALNGYGIPIAISKKTPRLYSGKSDGLWKDGPNAITKIRNELVHPRDRIGTKIGPYIYEVWQLANWYIELMLLRMSEYNGVYSNRLNAEWVGQVETVPWSNKAANSRTLKVL